MWDNKNQIRQEQGKLIEPHKLGLIRAKLIFYLYHGLKRFTVCAS